MKLPNTLTDLIVSKAKNSPEEIILHAEKNDNTWEAITWSTFYNDIANLSHSFHKLGIKKGERVGLMAGVRYEWEVIDKALLSIGAVVVNIDVRSTTKELEVICEDANVTSFIAETEEMITHLSKGFITTANAMACIDHNDDGTELHSIKKLMATSALENWQLSRPDPESMATIFYTSGTTGKPKGVAYTHKQLMMVCEPAEEIFAEQLKQQQVSVHWLPLSNATGRCISTLSLCLGIQMYFVSDPKKIIDKVRMIHPTFMFAVPRFYEKIYAILNEKLKTHPWFIRSIFNAAITINKNIQWKPLKKVMDVFLIKKVRQAIFGKNMEFMISGSAPLDIHIQRFFYGLGLPVLEGYGCTETIVLLSINSPTDYSFGSVGKVSKGLDIKFAADGEILVKGDAVFKGYLNDVKTDLFTDDGYYKTGDIGCMENDFIFIKGRKKEIIKTSTGLRVSPVEIEKVLERINIIDQAVVIGDRKKYLTALLTLNEEAVKKMCLQNNINPGNVNKLYSSPQVIEMMAKEIGIINKQFPSHKQIQQFKILEKSFLPETGELTYTLKLRRSYIEAKYQQVIQDMYQAKAA